MAGFFSVKNFELYQHYKDRDPPWIKLHFAILNDYEFAVMPDAAKAHLLAIGLLASRSKNKIPFDSEWVGKRINATCPVDLDAFVAAGWIILDPSASKALAPRKQDALVETETEAETQEKRQRQKVPLPLRAKEKRAKPRSQIGDFEPNQETALEHWRSIGRSDIDSAEQADQFKDHHTARAATMADWPAAWRTWYRNAPKMNRQERHGRGNDRPSPHETFAGAALDLIRERRSASGKGRDDPGVAE